MIDRNYITTDVQYNEEFEALENNLLKGLILFRATFDKISEENPIVNLMHLSRKIEIESLKFKFKVSNLPRLFSILYFIHFSFPPLFVEYKRGKPHSIISKFTLIQMKLAFCMTSDNVEAKKEVIRDLAVLQSEVESTIEVKLPDNVPVDLKVADHEEIISVHPANTEDIFEDAKSPEVPSYVRPGRDFMDSLDRQLSLVFPS